MSGQSSGLIETVGLTAAVEAADAAMKSANVALVGYELAKGDGLVTVKLTGDVGAMNAAVAAGVAAANRVGRVWAWKVIARTATGIDKLIASKETCGATAQEGTSRMAEDKERVIPVTCVEPSITTPGCIEFGDDMLPVELPSSQETKRETPGTRSKNTAKPASEPAENAGQSNKKPPRTRKSTRRE